MSPFIRPALVLSALILGVYCHPVAAQEAKSQPVARLISSSSINPPVMVSTVPGPSLDEANAIERRAFEQTNVVRVKNGLQPFVWDAEVCQIARTHSESMSRLGFFSHTTPSGHRLRDRARVGGILRFSVLAENISFSQGYEDPGAFAVERWMLSPKHRDNILSREFRAMAIGSFVAADGSVYLTQTFITR